MIIKVCLTFKLLVEGTRDFAVAPGPLTVIIMACSAYPLTIRISNFESLRRAIFECIAAHTHTDKPLPLLLNMMRAIEQCKMIIKEALFQQYGEAT